MLIRFSKRIASILFMMLFASSFSISHAEAFSLSPNNINQLPQDAYQIAKITFLPEVKDSDLGWGDDSLKGDYNDKNCSSYPLSACPTGGKCEKCPFNITMYRVYACDDPYLKQDGTCVCPPKVDTSCTNDVCTKYCEDSCINKTCTPSPNQTNCTNGTQKCDNGCCQNTRDCCIPCTNKTTSKPANSSYTYSSCTDGEGSKQIQTGWTCNSGYHEKNGACEKDCQIDSCSAYPLTSCPENGTCSKCTKTAQDCSTDGTRYKLDSCASGFVVSGNSCREQTCEEKGQKTCNGSCIATSECCGGCPSGKKCSNGTCVASLSVGDILYSDKTTSSDVIPGKTPIGVVIDTSNYIAVSLVEKNGNWNDSKNYANSFSAGGVGGWSLPSTGYLEQIYNNRTRINSTLAKLNATQFSKNVYWSPSKGKYDNTVKCMNFQYGVIGDGWSSSLTTIYARPVLKYK